jgi:hypothetical protein
MEKKSEKNIFKLNQKLENLLKKFQEVTKMIKVTITEWNKISKDYKGKWERHIKENGWQPDLPEEYIGKRTVLSGCISEEIGSLLTEDVHFVIVK